MNSVQCACIAQPSTVGSCMLHQRLDEFVQTPHITGSDSFPLTPQTISSKFILSSHGGGASCPPPQAPTPLLEALSDHAHARAALPVLELTPPPSLVAGQIVANRYCGRIAKNRAV
eukprot:scaffold210390_cov34-Tisochrysis_lutea.AAC.2